MDSGLFAVPMSAELFRTDAFRAKISYENAQNTPCYSEVSDGLVWDRSMRRKWFVAAVITTLALISDGAQASIRITFVKPETFRDDDFRNRARRENAMAAFTKYFELLDRRYLTRNQQLSIEITDIRLAGQYEPWRPRYADVRILRDITPPRFSVRYRFKSGGTVVTGQETITDMNYLSLPGARYSGDQFVYEKEMLRDWFRKRFVQKRRPAG
ncbi:DUF3016 domain-containing protein [Rhizobium cauense]|uniref:DUF3016 domain-containing protein n=1 Tax=Rhizobium cauense TaxID=1166683 RepID=UPI001C6E12DD|nr:DUF3016 domain-containing protein [Rhizobium cauense]MBW9117015.1 DUF3016 domain-containing protein [Rhizobium cauense]